MLNRMILSLLAVLAMPTPPHASPEVVRMMVGPRVAVACDQLLVSKVVDTTPANANYKAVSEVKNCVTPAGGTKVFVMGVAPGGYVYIVRTGDVHGVWTRNEWLQEVK